jgi:ribosomal protein S18 acetylase RimI-like enzyme
MAGFTLRPMRAADKPVMLDIASRTWEGGDYLPSVFDDWLADGDGGFVAALLDDRVVGCGKLTFLTPGDAWLEGLRKDPAVSEGGLAEMVTRHLLRRLAGRPGLRSVRFSTYVCNERSIAVNERLGFRRRNVFSCKAWTGKRGEAGGVDCPHAGRASVVRDPAEVRRFVEGSSWLAGSDGFLCEGWRVYPYSWDLFRIRYLETGRCLGVLDGGRLAGLAAFAHDTRFDRTYVKLTLIEAADCEVATALLDALFAYVRDHARDDNEIEMILPPGTRIGAWAAERGFRSWEREDDFLLYELPLPLLAAFAEEDFRR